MKRKLLAYVAVRSGAASLLRYALRGSLTVLAYHRIGGTPSAFDHLFDDSVFTCSDAVLDEHMAQLVRLRSVVTLDQVCDALDGKARLPPRAALVTFDDATQDHYSRALPVLRKHGVPAVFFVSTRSLVERTVEWWNLLGYTLRTCAAGSYELGKDFGGRVQLDDISSRNTAIETITRHIKLRSDAGDALPTVEGIAAAVQVTLPSRDAQSSGLLDANQLREMCAAGMTIGSHSHSHAFLRRLSPDEQLSELRTSKQVLEDIVGQPVRSLAYPYGQSMDYDSTTQNAARQAGYACAFNLMKRKVVSIRTVNRFDIDRFPVPANSGYEFVAAISGVPV
jgi:peptidoglycan/xylan/chitin deacetylase (PgdA/CDA1 family)